VGISLAIEICVSLTRALLYIDRLDTCCWSSQTSDLHVCDVLTVFKGWRWTGSGCQTAATQTGPGNWRWTWRTSTGTCPSESPGRSTSAGWCSNSWRNSVRTRFHPSSECAEPSDAHANCGFIDSWSSYTWLFTDSTVIHHTLHSDMWFTVLIFTHYLENNLFQIIKMVILCNLKNRNRF